MCQPGLPWPQGDSQEGSPSFALFHKTKSRGSFLESSSAILAPGFRSSIFLLDNLPYSGKVLTAKKTSPPDE